MSKDEVSKNVTKLMKEQKPIMEQQFLDLLRMNDTKGTLRTSDPFCNPVGSTFHNCGPELIKWVVEGGDIDNVRHHIMSIMKIRSLGSSAPSAAVSFLLGLKRIFRNVICTFVDKPDREEPLLMIESRIDQLLLIAVDCYAQCRDRIGEIRINEAKAERDRLLRLVKHMGDGARR